MNALATWMVEYLINSVWMIPLIFCAAWIAANVVRRSGEAWEHRVWVGALLLEAALPACRVQVSAVLRGVRELAVWPWHQAVQGEAHVGIVIGPGSAAGSWAMPHLLMTGVAVAYGVVFAFFGIRFAWSAWKTRLLLRHSEALALPEELESVWKQCCAAFDIPAIEIVTSSAIAGPVTLGVRRSMVLLPRGFIERVDLADLKAAMAHECAHIRRHDFILHLLYRTLMLPVAYHPGAWLTLTRIAVTREMVCDAMAAKFVDGRERYARSLLRLASAHAHAAPAQTLHAIGILDANTFERRVMRLTARRVEIGRALRLTTAVACVGIGAVTCASALALRTEVAASNASPADQKTEHASARVSAGVMAGNILYQKTPVYPAEAKTNHISGAVVLKAVISKEGIVERLEVVSGPEELRASALDAVKEWRYKPYLLNGQPTDVETTITVNYHLEQ
jgi:TonB family protein